MASGETVLKWKAELLGADNVKDGLRKINAEVKAGTLTQGEANKAISAASRETRNYRAEQNLLTKSFMSTHPALNTLTRSMSTFGSVARSGLSIANSLNIMWIRQNQTASALSDANYEVAVATRELANARKEGDVMKIAEAEERLNAALEKQTGLKTGDFWTNLLDVATVGLSMTQAVSTIFTNLMKNEKIAKAIMGAGKYMGGIFGGMFTFISNGIIKAGEWVGSLSSAKILKSVATAGRSLGGVFGMSLIAGTLVAGAVMAAYLIPVIEKSFSDANKKKAKETGQEINSPESQFQTKDEYLKTKYAMAGAAVDWFDMFKPLTDLLTKGLPEAYGESEEGYNNSMASMITTTDTGVGSLAEGFTKGWEGITNVTNSFGAGLVSGVNNVFSSLISSMNSAISSYNRAAKKMHKSTISSISFTPNQFTDIPMPTVKAATGFEGMINRPTMFLAGEAGPENVSISPNGGKGGGSSTLVINIQGSLISERELFGKVDTYFKNELRKRNFRMLQ